MGEFKISIKYKEEQARKIIEKQIDEYALELGIKIKKAIDNIANKVKPPIKGEVTPGKLKWRGITITLEQSTPTMEITEEGMIATTEVTYYIYQRGVLIDTNDK